MIQPGSKMRIKTGLHRTGEGIRGDGWGEGERAVNGQGKSGEGGEGGGDKIHPRVGTYVHTCSRVVWRRFTADGLSASLNVIGHTSTSTDLMTP